MLRKIVVIVVLGLLSMALPACGGDEGEMSGANNVLTPLGDVANGEALFTQATIGENHAPGCITCHSLEPDVVIVGPSQAGLATRAETRVPGLTAEEYIRESIINPNAYVVEGFAEGVMYQNYATDLTADQIDDIVAYTLSLK